MVEGTVKAAHEKVEQLADRDADTTASDIRYLAYGARLRTALRAGTRYFAYTSDVGEAFRPVAPPWVVTAAYGISWLYVSADVAYESYKAYHRGPSPIEAANFSEPSRVAIAAVQRATFQSIASMGLPALTIHTVVAQSRKAFRNATNTKVRIWGPTTTGLAVVPILPYLFDQPVEKATEYAFDWIREKIIEQRQSRTSSPDRKEL
ncbi:mitochondrial 18 KDa protein-domain-containing protein [Gymnopilus junonius]|uniref:Mitochondrial fission process protein 1 n=1 Tax=Gymnopilus junonius TaxID=109634 RepID=A0A9P5NLT6_GYMJU|nr:mitochondrial 18 KDa protein-domain-containing protein [Gymnopilus junonius]